MDKFTWIGSLYEFYGALLPKRQQEATALYYEENCSLTEIAEEFGISRQGVYDALRSAEKALEGYEAKLGLARRFETQNEQIEQIEQSLYALLAENTGQEDPVRRILAQIEHLRETGNR